jgi:hypothetical protein
MLLQDLVLHVKRKVVSLDLRSDYGWKLILNKDEVYFSHSFTNQKLKVQSNYTSSGRLIASFIDEIAATKVT